MPGEPDSDSKPRHEAETASTEPQYSVSREDWTKFVEMDLWSRFQGRLWKLVAGFLTVVALAGIFGIPYFIRTEINDGLQETKRAFAEQEDALVSYSKLLDLLQLQYSDERASLTSDAYALIRNTDNALAKLPKQQRDIFNFGPTTHWWYSRGVPVGIVDRGLDRTGEQDISPTVMLLDPKSPFSRLEVTEPAVVYTEGTSRNLSLAESLPHPIRDGTFLGELKDILYRSVYLRADEVTMKSLRSDLLSTARENQPGQRTPTVESLYNYVYLPRFKTNLDAAIKTQLDKEQAAELGKYLKLYNWPSLLELSN